MATKTNTRSKKKTYTKKSPEQRQAETKDLQERQKAAILELLHSDQWTNYLNTMRRFRRYSFANTMLILAQKPDATHVAGYRKWQEFGRQVVSGRGSSLKIWGVPYRPKIWIEKGTQGNRHVFDEKDGQVKVEADFTRCPILSVFDISQTEGDPLPEIVTPLADTDDTTANTKTIDGLSEWLTGEGWTVRHEAMSATTKGYTSHTDKVIALNEDNSIAQDTKTLIHEAAHALLHEDRSEYVAHRGAAEVQAESVAYVVAGMLGLDTSGYSTGYVMGWAVSEAGSMEEANLIEVLHNTAAGVKKAVDTIIDALEANGTIPAAETLEAA